MIKKNTGEINKIKTEILNAENKDFINTFLNWPGFIKIIDDTSKAAANKIMSNTLTLTDFIYSLLVNYSQNFNDCNNTDGIPSGLDENAIKKISHVMGQYIQEQGYSLPAGFSIPASTIALLYLKLCKKYGHEIKITPRQQEFSHLLGNILAGATSSAIFPQSNNIKEETPTYQSHISFIPNQENHDNFFTESEERLALPNSIILQTKTNKASAKTIYEIAPHSTAVLMVSEHSAANICLKESNQNATHHSFMSFTKKEEQTGNTFVAFVTGDKSLKIDTSDVDKNSQWFVIPDQTRQKHFYQCRQLKMDKK